MQLKEIIYTVIFAGLGILLIILLIAMFLNKGKGADLSDNERVYIPGIYTAALILNDTALNLEVVVDKNNINSVEIVNIDEATTTMYPLIEPSLENIADQLYDGVKVESVEVSNNGPYTQEVMLDTIKVALEKAKVKTVQ